MARSAEKDGSVAPNIQYGYIAYQLVASLLGAFAIAQFVEHFVHIDWHGMLANQAAVWNFAVTPIQQFFFTRMERISGEHFEPFWRDYLTVGAVVLLSFARASIAFDMSSTRNQFVRWGELLLEIVQHALLWPIAFIRASLAVFERDPKHAPYIVLLTLTPFVYLAILFGVNAFLH